MPQVMTTIDDIAQCGISKIGLITVRLKLGSAIENPFPVSTLRSALDVNDFVKCITVIKNNDKLLGMFAIDCAKQTSHLVKDASLKFALYASYIRVNEIHGVQCNFLHRSCVAALSTADDACHKNAATINAELSHALASAYPFTLDTQRRVVTALNAAARSIYEDFLLSRKFFIPLKIREAIARKHSRAFVDSQLDKLCASLDAGEWVEQ